MTFYRYFGMAILIFSVLLGYGWCFTTPHFVDFPFATWAMAGILIALALVTMTLAYCYLLKDDVIPMGVCIVIAILLSITAYYVTTQADLKDLAAQKDLMKIAWGYVVAVATFFLVDSLTWSKKRIAIA